MHACVRACVRACQRVICIHNVHVVDIYIYVCMHVSVCILIQYVCICTYTIHHAGDKADM